MGSRKIGELLILSLIWLIIGWVLHGQYANFLNSNEQDRLSRVLSTLQEKQFRFHRFSDEQFVDEVILKMIELSEDPFATYIRPPLSDKFRGRLEESIGGVGIIYEQIDERIIIDEVAANGSASVAGIRVGDQIVAIDGVEIAPFSPGEISVMLNGPIGSSVEVSVSRSGELLTFALARWEKNSLTAKMIGPQIGYLKLERFSQSIVDPTLSALEELINSGAQGIVWDLRNNGGGSMQATEKILNFFLEAGTHLYSVELTDREDRIIIESGHYEGAQPDISLIVLVDDTTLSSSEMAIAAIMTHERGIVIGQTTGGKGVIQETVSIDEGYLLQLSIGKWLTPNGEWVHEEGVEPDIYLVDDEATLVDEPLEFAVEQLGRSNNN